MSTSWVVVRMRPRERLMWCLAPNRQTMGSRKYWLVSSPSHESLRESSLGILGGSLEEVALDLRLNASQSSRRTLWEEGKKEDGCGSSKI